MNMGIAQASATMKIPGQYSHHLNMGMGGNGDSMSVTRPGQPAVVIRYIISLTGPG